MSAEAHSSPESADLSTLAQSAGKVVVPKTGLSLVTSEAESPATEGEVAVLTEDDIFLKDMTSPANLHRRESLLTTKIIKNLATYRQRKIDLPSEKSIEVQTDEFKYEARETSLRILFMSYGYFGTSIDDVIAFNDTHKAAEISSTETNLATYDDLDTRYQQDPTQTVLGLVFHQAKFNIADRNMVVQMRKTSLLLLDKLGIAGQNPS